MSPEGTRVYVTGYSYETDSDFDYITLAYSLVPPSPAFHRGDPNDDGRADLSDAIAILSFLFLGAAAPTCRESADTNNDGTIDLTDPISLLGFLFLGGSAPAEPGPPAAACGHDPDPPGSPRHLGCAAYEHCR